VIYEMTTYDLRPRSVPAVERQFALAYVQRRRHSELIGSFHTEFGPLNQIVQIWKYTDIAEREIIIKRVAEEGDWPPNIADSLVRIRTELMTPVSFSPELKPGKIGPYFELRTYAYPLGELAKMMGAWRRAMPMRDALGSSVAAIWTTEIGALNSLTHLWPYRSLEDRERIRNEVQATGKWPPYKLDELEGGSGYTIVSQENKLMLPSSFSPVQ
jgi:hypothetical protein